MLVCLHYVPPSQLKTKRPIASYTLQGMDITGVSGCKRCHYILSIRDAIRIRASNDPNMHMDVYSNENGLAQDVAMRNQALQLEDTNIPTM